MKKNPIVLLALSAICAGCSVSGSTASSSSASSDGDTYSSSSSEPSSSASSAESNTSSSTSDSSSEVPSATIDDVITAISSADVNKIAGGKLTTKVESSWSAEGGDKTSVNYDYGDGVFHMSGSDYDGSYDLYLVSDTDGSIVAIKKSSDGSVSKPYTTYDVAALPFESYLGYDLSAYSAEGFVKSLATVAKTDPNKDVKASYSDGVYSFSFGDLLNSWYFYTVSVSFVVSNGAMSKADAVITQWGSDAFITDDELGTTSLIADASYYVRTTYSIEQTVADRTFTNPYNLEDFIATSFTLTDSNGNAIGDTYTMTADTSASLLLTSVTPATANFDFDTPRITVTGGTGLSARYASYSKSITLNPSKAGNYTVKIETKKVTKTISVVVEQPKPTNVDVAYYVASPGGYNWSEIKNKTINAYTGVDYYFSPTVTPYTADKTLNVTVDGEEGAYSITKTDIYLYEGSTTPASTYAFKATKAGTYAVSFTSVADSSVGYTVTINVADTPSYKDVLGNDYGFAYRSGAVKYTFNFGSFDTTGANGDVTIKDVQNNKSEVATYVIAPNETTGMNEFTLTHVSGDDLCSSFSLALGPDFTLYMVETYGTYVSTYVLSVADPQFYLAQYWKGVTDGMTFAARFWDSGTVDLSMKTSSLSVNYSYSTTYSVSNTLTDNGYVVTIDAGDSTYSEPFFALPSSFYLSSDYKTLSASFTCTKDQKDYSFSLAYATAGRGD